MSALRLYDDGVLKAATGDRPDAQPAAAGEGAGTGVAAPLPGGATTPVQKRTRWGRRGRAGATLKHALGPLVIAALVALVLAQVPLAVAGRSERAYTQTNLIRLHVVANSDAPSDQELKLRVRDAVLDELTPLLAPVSTGDEAQRVIAGELEGLERAAQGEVFAAGREYPVAVELGCFPFPAKSYGQLIMPAGEYEALRVTIGRGQGNNWWCVLFPPLCLIDLKHPAAAAAALDSAAAGGAGGAAGGTAVAGLPGVVAIASDPATPPEVRFFIIDWLKQHGVDLGELWRRVVSGHAAQ